MIISKSYGTDILNLNHHELQIKCICVQISNV
jgi:hypothetical protein